MALQPLVLVGVDLVAAQHDDAGLAQRLAQIGPDALLAGGQVVRLGGDRGELLGRVEPVGRPLLDPEQLLALEARRPGP